MTGCETSGRQIRAQECAAVMAKVESTMFLVAELNPLQRRQRERWRRIVPADPGQEGK